MCVCTHTAFYRIGEIVESRLQKTRICRARVINVRRNHTYDIQYDTGDELRLVNEKNLRLPPAKGDTAAIIEVGMVFYITTLPILLYIAIYSNVQYTRACISIGALIVAVVIFCVRVELLVNFVYHFKFAGVANIARLSLVYLAPVVIMMAAGSPDLVC
jgi:hypothetical protein